MYTNGASGSLHDSVRIGSKLVGHSQPSYVIAEIGINHNGDIDLKLNG